MSYFQYNWWSQVGSLALMVVLTFATPSVNAAETYLPGAPLRRRFAAINILFLWLYPGFDSVYRIAQGGFLTMFQAGWLSTLWTLVWIPVTLWVWPLFWGAVWPSRYGLKKYEPHR